MPSFSVLPTHLPRQRRRLQWLAALQALFEALAALRVATEHGGVLHANGSQQLIACG